MKEWVTLIISLINNKLLKRGDCIILFILIILLLAVPGFIGGIVEKGLRQTTLEQQSKHDKLIIYRNQISVVIDSILLSVRERLDADRAFVGEYSNTTYGLTGLPYLYFTIHNEMVKPGRLPISNQYQKQNSFNFKFNSTLYERNIYSIDNIEKVRDGDPLLYYMLKKNEANQVYLLLIKLKGRSGIEVPKAFIGVSYRDSTIKTHDQIFFTLSRAGGEIGTLYKRIEEIQ